MIENEIKMVLRNYDEIETILTAQYPWHDIQQGYLTNNNRIREIIHQNGLIEHVFSFKMRLPNGHNIEIETDDQMTKDDFDNLWKSTADRCNKRRFSIFSTSNTIRWDIDFPRWWSENKYFAMAEIEMPASMTAPDEILPIIAPFVVFTVPRDDNRFSARRLSDDDHAKKLAQELGLWNE